MSTRYHVPVAVGESNSPDTLNVRFGTLDQAIGNIDTELDTLVLGSGTSQAETIQARTGINYKSGTPPASLSVTMGYAAGDIFNVQAYGALGNGSADDRVAIQAAIDAAFAQGGGVVYLPPGTYRVTNPSGTLPCLTMKTNVILRGAGQRTIIDYRATVGCTCVDLSATTDAAVENLLIQNLSTVSAGSAIASDVNTVRMRVLGVVISGVTYIKSISSMVGNGTTITVTSSAHGLATGDDVYIYNTNLAGQVAGTTVELMYLNLTISDPNTFTINSNRINGTTLTGLMQRVAWFGGIHLGGADGLVDGCTLTGGFYSALRFAGTSTRNKITRCTVIDGLRGLMFDGDAPGATYNMASNNHFKDLKQAGSKIETLANHSILSDNEFINCSTVAFADSAIQVAGMYAQVMRNHLFWDVATMATAAIDVIDSGGGLMEISENMIQGHPGTAINLRTAAQNCIVARNVIDGANAGIASVGSFDMIIGNLIRNSISYGIRLLGSTRFVIAHNIIRTVTNGSGIRLENSPAYGAINSNIISDCATQGIVLVGSTSPTKYTTITGNVVYDIGNVTPSSAISLSGNTNHVTVVGNVCEDTNGYIESIQAPGSLSVIAIGNATDQGMDVTGTAIVANNY